MTIADIMPVLGQAGRARPASPARRATHGQMVQPAGRRRAKWYSNFGGNVFPTAAAALAEGGHVSIGIGDWAYPELGYPTSAELIHRTVRLVREVGREVATPDEARELLVC